jgi:predicted membrane protein
MHLADLWLGLSAIGYFFTGVGLRSRAFLVAGIVHLLGIVILPYFMGWQFLTAGLIMTANLLVFAESQWDMRPPIKNYALLTAEQKEFNQKQYLLRQARS